MQVLLSRYDAESLTEAVQLITDGLLPMSEEKHTWLFTAVYCIDSHISGGLLFFPQKLQCAANGLADGGMENCFEALQSAAKDLRAVCKVAQRIDWVDLLEFEAYMQTRIRWLSATADPYPTKQTDDMTLIAVRALLMILTPAFLTEKYHCQDFSEVWLGTTGGYCPSTPVGDIVDYMKWMGKFLPRLDEFLERLTQYEFKQRLFDGLDEFSGFELPDEIWGELVDFQFLYRLGRLLEIVPALRGALLKDLHDGFAKHFAEVHGLVQREADWINGLLTSLDWPTIPDSAEPHDFICVLRGSLIQLPGRFASSYTILTWIFAGCAFPHSSYFIMISSANSVNCCFHLVFYALAFSHLDFGQLRCLMYCLDILLCHS